MVLEEDKVLPRLFYGGHQLPSPMGGFLMLLGVRPATTGAATVLFECSASSLRYTLSIPKSTPKERSEVKKLQQEGEDPDCPRHGAGARLVRAGNELVCKLCGVSYGRV